MVKYSDKLQDPMSATRSDKVAIEFYLGQWLNKAAEAGVVKYDNPIGYKLTIEQLEILCIGSDLLDKEYAKKKDKLLVIFEKDKKILTKKINPNIRNSKMNKRIKKEVSEAELIFITELHRLLAITISPLLYTKYQLETI
jgi:hypothetical protein